MTDEVCSVGQDAGKLNVQELQGIANQGESGVMDVVYSLAATQAAQDQRLARAEATLEDCHSMLQQIMSHLGLPLVPAQRDEPAAAAAASLDMLPAAAAVTDPPPPQE